MILSPIEHIEILLLVAAVVAMVAQRLRVPYTVGLVAAGVALALTHYQPGFALTKSLIFTALLPPLIFEAAFALPWPDLKRDFAPVLLLSTGGVLLAATLTAAGMHFAAGWEWPAAALFGALIAATDPVSVIAVFKEAGLRGRLRLLVEAESLFNDGTAAVLFGLVLAVTVGGQTLTPGGVALNLLLSIGGGILCGLIVGGAALLLAGQTEDHLIEITFTTVAAYGSFLLAEHFHLSGVLATLACGLLLGNVGSLGSFSDRGHEAVTSFWEYAGFVANSLIFLLIGIRVAREPFSGFVMPLAIAVVTLGRAAAVYPLCALLRFSRWRIEARHQHVLFWGGLRGALALALVLGLPTNTPRRDEITAVAFGVVAFSIVVQGITMSPLLRRLGLLARPGTKGKTA